MRKIILVLFTVFFVLNLSTCFGPWEGDSGEGSLTVNIGSSARSVFYNTADDKVENFSHAITLKDDKGQIIFSSSNFQGTSITIKDIKVGKTYTLSIKGSDKENGLRSFGMESSILIKSGQNKVTVDMYSAMEAGNGGALSGAFEEAGKEKNSARMLYVFVNNTLLVDQTISFDSGNVILIAESEAGIGIKKESMQGSMFDVSGGATLRLGIEGMGGTITLQGLNGGNGNDAPLIMVNGGTLEMNEGVSIENNYNNSDGGGVQVLSGVFTMNGGTISKNQGRWGGGVQVQDGGKFNMYGGTISGNNATGNQESGGGGVQIGDYGTFIMSGGNITDNEAVGGGGGVQVCGNFTMSGGTINYNNAGTGGGGVQVTKGEDSSGKFIMEGGVISDNTATVDGGGVSVSGNDNVTFTMNGGTISGNEALNGGGVFVFDKGTFRMGSGAVISDNNAAGNGGGVCVFDTGTFEMNGGEIYGNEAFNSGGGLYISGGEIKYNDGTIYGINGGEKSNRATNGFGKSYWINGTSNDNTINVGEGIELITEFDLSNLKCPGVYEILSSYDDREYVMKVVKSNWAVVYFDLTAHKDQWIKIVFSAEVKREGAAGNLYWQVNNSDYPTVVGKNNADENIWHFMSGSWAGKPTGEPPFFSLSTYENNSESTTYYVANFEIDVQLTSEPIPGDLGDWKYGWKSEDEDNYQQAVWNLSSDNVTAAKIPGAKLVLEFSIIPSGGMELVWQGPANELWWNVRAILDENGNVIDGTSTAWDAETKTLTINLSEALADYDLFIDQPSINLIIAYYGLDDIGDLGILSARLE